MYNFALIGWPLEHSESPKLYTKFFSQWNIEGKYSLQPIQPEHFEIEVQHLKEQGIQCINVTFPYKEKILSCLPLHQNQAVSKIGATNTVDLRNNHAYNTDVIGFTNDLQRHNIDIKKQTVLILGAGGAAKAAIYALTSQGATVYVYNRTYSKAQNMSQIFENTTAVFWNEIPWDEITLIVQCTSLGIPPFENQNAWLQEPPDLTNKVVYDMVYYPRMTSFLTKAKEKNATIISGIGMLVLQAYASLEIFLGKKVSSIESLDFDALL